MRIGVCRGRNQRVHKSKQFFAHKLCSNLRHFSLARGADSLTPARLPAATTDQRRTAAGTSQVRVQRARSRLVFLLIHFIAF